MASHNLYELPAVDSDYDAVRQFVLKAEAANLQAEAGELGADPNARYDTYGERGTETVRWCKPADPNNPRPRTVRRGLPGRARSGSLCGEPSVGTLSSCDVCKATARKAASPKKPTTATAKPTTHQELRDSAND
ncbi:hypothetical protein [Kribbella sp. VKM Ac-2568]|uniref:hypothetical protein n=1 Tax=Kribbella sp. VKM Ac-2568 TaxID=2512219 RepID=UPI00104432FC|nr:hypothetical protein [Kribbella sp. VKM Ac-2568]TCM35140.1 hypothetical protein EV648_12533 [Kribbella sp. VKM Ac-2568]